MRYGQRIITKPREINTETPTVKTTTSILATGDVEEEEKLWGWVTAQFGKRGQVELIGIKMIPLTHRNLSG